MSAEKWHIDITSQVKGYIENGEVVLTFNKKPVTRFPLHTLSPQAEDGFVIDQGRILKKTRFDVSDFSEEYAKDCDMGWC